MDRRKFLMFFGVGTVASCLPVAIAACSSLLKVDEAFGQSDDSVVGGTVADLDNAGQIYRDNTAIGSITVVRGTGKNLVAVDPTCTHNGCTVNWDSNTKTFNCPCHGAKYDIYGNVLGGPTNQALKT